MTTVADYHSERSWHFLDLVDEEVERGELEEASNKLWGAAAQAIKAVAERRGWFHGPHSALADTVMRLIDDEGAPPFAVHVLRVGELVPLAVLWLAAQCR